LEQSPLALKEEEDMKKSILEKQLDV